MANTSLIISVIVSVSGLAVAAFSTYKAIQAAKKYAEDKIKRDHSSLEKYKSENKSSILAGS
jgi:hypothetical protein